MQHSVLYNKKNNSKSSSTPAVAEIIKMKSRVEYLNETMNHWVSNQMVLFNLSLSELIVSKIDSSTDESERKFFQQLKKQSSEKQAKLIKLYESKIKACFEKNNKIDLINFDDLDGLDDESLEKLIAIDTHISKLQLDNEKQLTEFEANLFFFFKQNGCQLVHNPIHPAMIFSAFYEAIEWYTGDDTSNELLSLYQMFFLQLKHNLPLILKTLNEYILYGNPITLTRLDKKLMTNSDDLKETHIKADKPFKSKIDDSKIGPIVSENESHESITGKTEEQIAANDAETDDSVIEKSGEAIKLSMESQEEDRMLMIHNEMYSSTSQNELPHEIEHFLENVWKKVMLNIDEKHTSKSEKWDSAMTFVDFLTWSYSIKNTVEEQHEIKEALPGVIQIIHFYSTHFKYPQKKKNELINLLTTKYELSMKSKAMS
ncbi:MAG: DUF1631 domain-containing protein [Gammaproteobacteria bacterium]|nr:DUF1631 domain-containing protein [Gammaproteobacteria bacterium]